MPVVGEDGAPGDSSPGPQAAASAPSRSTPTAARRPDLIAQNVSFDSRDGSTTSTSTRYARIPPDTTTANGAGSRHRKLSDEWHDLLRLKATRPGVLGCRCECVVHHVNVEGYVKSLGAVSCDFYCLANAPIEPFLVKCFHRTEVNSDLPTIVYLGTSIGEPAESEQNNFLRIDMTALNETAQRASAIMSIALVLRHQIWMPVKPYDTDVLAMGIRESAERGFRYAVASPADDRCPISAENLTDGSLGAMESDLIAEIFDLHVAYVGQPV